jgi:hypothetical protein
MKSPAAQTKFRRSRRGTWSAHPSIVVDGVERYLRLNDRHGGLLAEAASVVDNKLNVTGGVLSRFVVGPDRRAGFLLVVLTQAEADDSDHRVRVEIWPPTDDEPLRVTFGMPEQAMRGEIGFAYFPVEVTLPIDGRWVIVVAVGPGTISLPLIVLSRTRWRPRGSVARDVADQLDPVAVPVEPHGGAHADRVGVCQRHRVTGGLCRVDAVEPVGVRNALGDELAEMEQHRPGGRIDRVRVGLNDHRR